MTTSTRRVAKPWAYLLLPGLLAILGQTAAAQNAYKLEFQSNTPDSEKLDATVTAIGKTRRLGTYGWMHITLNNPGPERHQVHVRYAPSYLRYADYSVEKTLVLAPGQEAAPTQTRDRLRRSALVNVLCTLLAEAASARHPGATTAC